MSDARLDRLKLWFRLRRARLWPLAALVLVLVLTLTWVGAPLAAAPLAVLLGVPAWRMSLGQRPWLQAVLWLGMGVVGVSVPVMFVVDQRLSFAEPLAWVALLGFCWLSLCWAAMILAELAEVGLWGAERVQVLDPGRRRFLGDTLRAGLTGGAAFMTVAGVPAARAEPEVVRVDVPIDGLPDALHGFTIAQLSDIHVGQTIRRPTIQRLVDLVNGLDADLVAITGDIVDGSVDELREHVAPLGQLVARHGVVGCTGNHEYYSGVRPWLAHLGSLGVRMRVDDHEVIEHDGARVLIAGITDRSAPEMEPSHVSDPATAIAGHDGQADARVLLAHQPRSAPDAAALDFFDLQLSGHTHAGQYFPGTWLIHLAQPFAQGMHRLGRMWIYTNRSSVYWGPPNRLGSSPEITLLRLVRRG